MTTQRIKYCLGLCSFLLGVIIYLLWRDESILCNKISVYIGLMDALQPLRSYVSGLNMPEWFRFSLPDGLWIIAYMFMIDAALPDRNDKFIWISVIPLIGILSELLQWIDLFPGTFDFVDLLFYATPYNIYIIWLKNHLLSLQKEP